jgi:hypothetical protein
MMHRLANFIEEDESFYLLQYHGRLHRAIMDRTPKCYPEMAGKGIEYSWGFYKGMYCACPSSV